MTPQATGYARVSTAFEWTPEARYVHARVGEVRGPMGCWIWGQARNHGGYGVATWGDRYTPAHRLSYIAFRGPIPPGLQVRHICHTPACVNPDHLRVGTAKDNTQDSIEVGRGQGARTHCPHGHAYDERNTCVSTGRRHCRTCMRERMRAKRRKVGLRGNFWSQKTHCPSGHPYDEQNTRWYQGRRYCKACHRVGGRRP